MIHRYAVANSVAWVSIHILFHSLALVSIYKMVKFQYQIYCSCYSEKATTRAVHHWWQHYETERLVPYVRELYQDFPSD